MTMTVLFDNGTHKAETAGREPNAEEYGRAWRDSELAATDKYVPLTDHPKRSDILAYRQLLRDWPNSVGFPNKRPTSPI